MDASFLFNFGINYSNIPMDNLLLIILSLGAGIILRQLKSVPEQTHKGFNVFIIYISLPAITLYYVPKLAPSWQMAYPLLMPWVVLLIAWGFFALLGHYFHWKKEIVGALTSVAGLGNISFVGYPVMEMLYGEEGLEVAIFVGQGGFLAVSVIGVLIASHYSSSQGNWQEIFWKLVTFPPFQAFVIAILIWAFNIQYPEALANGFKSLGNTLTPLAMASVGFQLQWQFKGVSWRKLSWGLAYKLVLAPIAIWILYSFGLSEAPLLLRVSVMEAGMPPMVTAAIIADQYNLAPKLATMLVGLGLLVSAVTLTLGYFSLGG